MEKRARKILSALDCSNDCEISILLVDDIEIREINKKYLERDYPTDVISFAMREGEFPSINDNILGDVVISLDNAEEYAKEKGVAFDDEVTYLLIHGILHLLGYDHEREGSDPAKMKEKENELYKLVTI